MLRGGSHLVQNARLALRIVSRREIEFHELAQCSGRLADARLSDEHDEAAHACESTVQMRSERLQFTLAANEDGGRSGRYACCLSSDDVTTCAAKAGLIEIDLTTGSTYRCHSCSITRTDQMNDDNVMRYFPAASVQTFLVATSKKWPSWEKIPHKSSPNTSTYVLRL
jgi:hypothetical protein